jgi:hypothetical protein
VLRVHFGAESFGTQVTLSLLPARRLRRLPGALTARTGADGVEASAPAGRARLGSRVGAAGGQEQEEEEAEWEEAAGDAMGEITEHVRAPSPSPPSPPDAAPHAFHAPHARADK